MVATLSREAVIPRGWWMVVEPVKEETTAGGLLLPEGMDEKMDMTSGILFRQRVVAVSTDPILNDEGQAVPAHDYRPGDIVIAPPGRTLVDSSCRPVAFLIDERNVVAVLK